MAPSRGHITRGFLYLLVATQIIKRGLCAKYRRGRVYIKKDQQTPKPEDVVKRDGEVWDPLSPFPRSKFLVHAYLKMHEVVPDIIPVSPNITVEVVYANSICVDFGNELTPNQVNVMPHRTVWPVEIGAYYTIILFSPDYPSRRHPTESQYVYWFVANIHDTCVAATGTTFTEYDTPYALSNETDWHRFIFVVYKQPFGIQPYHLPYSPKGFHESRKRFNVSKFAENQKLGIPVAVNLFQMAPFDPINLIKPK